MHNIKHKLDGVHYTVSYFKVGFTLYRVGKKLEKQEYGIKLSIMP